MKQSAPAPKDTPHGPTDEPAKKRSKPTREYATPKCDDAGPEPEDQKSEQRRRQREASRAKCYANSNSHLREDLLRRAAQRSQPLPKYKGGERKEYLDYLLPPVPAELKDRVRNRAQVISVEEHKVRKGRGGIEQIIQPAIPEDEVVVSKVVLFSKPKIKGIKGAKGRGCLRQGRNGAITAYI